MIGDEVEGVQKFLELYHPMSEGIVKNWAQME